MDVKLGLKELAGEGGWRWPESPAVPEPPNTERWLDAGSAAPNTLTPRARWLCLGAPATQAVAGRRCKCPQRS